MNAIPTHCSCTFIIEEQDKNNVENIIKKNLEELKQDFPIETDIKISLDIKPLTKETKALTEQSSLQFINVLTSIRHGILRMHPVFKDKVDSSLNLAVVKLTTAEKDEIIITCLSRASTNTEFDKIDFAMKSILEMTPLKNELITTKGEREELWRLYREDKNIDKNEIKEKIDKLSNKIVRINDDINLCKKIELKKENIKEDIKKIEEKEMINDEFIR